MMAEQRREEEDRKLRELKGEYVKPKSRQGAAKSVLLTENAAKRFRQQMPAITENYLHAMQDAFQNNPDLQLIPKAEILPEE